MLNVNKRISIADSELNLSFSRSPGPGGQNVNKVNSKVTLRWNVSQTKALPEDVRERFVQHYDGRINRQHELILSSHRYRDQSRNITDCLNKLRTMILEVVTPPVKRRTTRPTAASKRRRLDVKKRNSQRKKLRRSPRGDD